MVIQIRCYVKFHYIAELVVKNGQSKDNGKYECKTTYDKVKPSTYNVQFKNLRLQLLLLC